MTLVGQKELKFTKLEAVRNETAMKVTANAQFSQLVASGWFRSNILVNEFRYNAKARFHLICSDVKAKLVVSGALTDDGTSFDIKSIDMTPTVKNMKFNITAIGADNNVSKSQLKFKFREGSLIENFPRRARQSVCE